MSKNNLYKEPSFQWGASKSTIKSYMNGYSLQVETSTALGYLGKHPVELYAYLFKNNMMNCSAAQLPGIYAEQLIEFLMDRYVYVDKVDDMYAFCSVDKDMLIGLSVNVDNNYNAHCMVMYTPINIDAKTRNASNMFDEFKKLSEEIKNSFQN